MAAPGTVESVQKTQPRVAALKLGVSWEAFLFILVACFQLALVLAHSPWRDEFQAALIAKQPPQQIFASLHYEGHPALWYLILAALERVAPAPIALKLAQAAVALGSQALIWRASPFGWRTKLVLSLGYFVLFEYGVIARSYGLGALLFLWFVAVRRTFWAWVLLGAMCNVEAHVAVLATFGVIILLVVERRRSVAGLALFGIAALLAVASMTRAPHAFNGPAYLANDHLVRLLSTLRALAADILPVLPGQFPITWQWAAPAPLDWLLGALVPVLGVITLRRDVRLAAIFLLFCLALIGVAVTIYPMLPRHSGYAIVLLIGLLWIDKERAGADPPALGLAWLGLLALCGLWVGICSFLQPFGPASSMNTWIREHGLARGPWAAYEGYLGTDISGEIGVPTFNLEKGCWNTFLRWDYDRERALGADEAEKRLAAFASATGGGLVLSDKLLASSPQLGVQRLASFPPSMSGPPLFIYSLGAASPKPRPLPLCP